MNSSNSVTDRHSTCKTLWTFYDQAMKDFGLGKRADSTWVAYEKWQKDNIIVQLFSRSLFCALFFF